MNIVKKSAQTVPTMLVSHVVTISDKSEQFSRIITEEIVIDVRVSSMKEGLPTFTVVFPYDYCRETREVIEEYMIDSTWIVTCSPQLGYPTWQCYMVSHADLNRLIDRFGGIKKGLLPVSFGEEDFFDEMASNGAWQALDKGLDAISYLKDMYLLDGSKALLIHKINEAKRLMDDIMTHLEN